MTIDPLFPSAHNSVRTMALSMATFVMLSLALPVQAASNTMHNPTAIPTTPTIDPAMKRYPEMTEAECKSLASNRKKYKKSDYMSRKEYCRQMLSNPAGPATEQYQDNKLMDNDPSARSNVDTGNRMDKDSADPRDDASQGGITPRNNMDTPPANAKE